jgi:hypothetical protein
VVTVSYKSSQSSQRIFSGTERNDKFWWKTSKVFVLPSNTAIISKHDIIPNIFMIAPC